MSKRFREAFITSAKPTKRFRGDDEETRVDEDQGEPGDLRKFLTNKRMIELLEGKGIKALFPIQYRTYATIFGGKAKDKTGSGKTLAFSLPVIERFRKEKVFREGKNPKFLIMLPTRYASS
jgi:superfamily II DNA/RNA helicase